MCEIKVTDKNKILDAIVGVDVIFELLKDFRLPKRFEYYLDDAIDPELASPELSHMLREAYRLCGLDIDQHADDIYNPCGTAREYKHYACWAGEVYTLVRNFINNRFIVVVDEQQELGLIAKSYRLRNLVDK